MKKTLKTQTNNQEMHSTKKKYIERIAEAKEAEREIKDYQKQQDSCINYEKDRDE